MTVPLDRRTRRHADVRELDAAAFFADDIHDLIDAHGHLLVEGAEFLDAPPLAVETDGAGWTIAVEDGRPEVTEGVVAGAFVLSFTPEQFSDWAQDLQSIHAMDIGRTLVHRNGSEHEISLWDSL